jgi:hypothetical protein
MTATWTMEATTADGKHVSLSFYSGPSAPPPNYVTLSGRVSGGNSQSERLFSNQYDADEWAAKLGVQRWCVTRHWRAFPEASRIPVQFGEAPDDERLIELIRAFESGTSLKDLVNGVMINDAGRQFQVHPNLLRLWLIGAAPDHPSLQRLKRGS